MLNSILTCYAICGSVQNMATTSPDALVNRLSKCSPEFTKGLIAHSYGYLSVLDKHDIAPQTVGDKALIELVRLGPKGLGTLIKRLSDRAPTPITYRRETSHTMYLFSETADRRLDEVAHPRSAEVGGFPDQAVPDVVRLTVGDLCFFALGQITNRDFRPVQDENQQVFRITVPSLQPGLADSVKERAPRDLAELECDLVRDALTPDTFLRDAGALVRLRHYYPQTAPVALRLRLLAPFTDKGLGEVSDNYRDRLLYPGTITADQIELILARVETPISAATRSTIQTLKQRMLLRSNSENRERTLKAIEAVLKSSPQHHEKNSSLAKPLAAAIGSR